ncbi:MAG: hypothetical protein J3Q66DRAFT_398586 [Benniella sp.]|nr:MAG: hypothetical protein J3Q66DRAFT_398586 [Benniella sp.]
MPQLQLPPECILVIISILCSEDDTDTMARLLRVNKAICAATLPFLYEDCFVRRMRAHQHSVKSYDLSLAQLIRTLLRQVHPQSRIPELLKITFLSQDDQVGVGSTQEPSLPPPTTTTPAFKYGYFLRMVRIYYQLGDWMVGFICNNSPLMDYAATNQIYEKHVNEGYIVKFIHDECRDKALGRVLEMDIYQQLTWTLCQDHPETIESLIIPLKDIQRYIDHIHHFTSLSNVTFSVRETGRYRYGVPIYGPNLYEIEQEERDRLFGGMLEFVRQHTSIHKNVLRNIEAPPSTELDGTDQHSRLDVYFTILSLSPPFQNVRSICTNWIELLARHTDTNLNCMESINAMTRGGDWEAEDESKLLSKYPPLLPRCRVLKHLSTKTLGPDMFQWAVLEKREKETERHQEGILGRHLCSWQQKHHTRGLVPLQSIRMYHNREPPLVQELNDIGFAFGDSLEELYVDDGIWRDDDIFVDQTAASRVVLHGQGWNLPRLRTLSLEMFDLKLHFDMDALQRSRALESLTMHDDMVTYRHRDIRSWSVVHLPQLKKLDLQGSPAIHFNMGSLHHSPCLEELNLRMAIISPYQGDRHYRMPSPEELEREDSDTEGIDSHEPSGILGSNQGYLPIGRRPRYTWDWHLPNLKKLNLAAVFAFMFDFQWLQYLPNLQTLYLGTSSSTNSLHERHITLKDLSKKEQQQELEEDGSRETLSDRYISLPKLESIELDGPWIFEEKVLEILFLTVAPNMHWISFGSDCTGYILEECIILSRKMLQMEKVYLDMRLARDEIQRTGLVSWDSLQDEQRKKRRVTFYLDGGMFYDAQEP